MNNHHLTDVRCVDLAQDMFLDLVEKYHGTVHMDNPCVDINNKRMAYRLFAEMSFLAVTEFDKKFGEWFQDAPCNPGNWVDE